jgi:hypothetical protein
MGKTHLRQQITAHGAGITDELDTLLQRQQGLQRCTRALGRFRLDTQRQCLLGHAIATFERSGAAQASEWVDDQTYMKTRHAFLDEDGWHAACLYPYAMTDVTVFRTGVVTARSSSASRLRAE